MIFTMIEETLEIFCLKCRFKYEVRIDVKENAQYIRAASECPNCNFLNILSINEEYVYEKSVPRGPERVEVPTRDVKDNRNKRKHL